MRPERLGEQKLGRRESCGQSVASGRQIAAHMHAGRKEIRQQDDATYAMTEAVRGPGVDVRLGQLEVGGFNMDESAGLPELVGQSRQVGVRFRLTAPVSDQQECRSGDGHIKEYTEYAF